MRIPALKCLKCNDIVYSRANHDFRSCTCGHVFVDAGPGYGRAGGTDCVALQLNMPKVTRRMLFVDWNHGKDKYGLIPGDNGLVKAIKRSKKKPKGAKNVK